MVYKFVGVALTALLCSVQRVTSLEINEISLKNKSDLGFKDITKAQEIKPIQDKIIGNNHPMVQGQANVISLETRGENEFYGPLYVGSENIEVRLIYDTTLQQTTINNEDATNSNLPSFYDAEASETSQVQYKKSKGSKQQVSEASLDMGTVNLEGKDYTDNMCLYQIRNGRTSDTGRLCVRNMPFISVSEIVGTFNANGVIGLAPNGNGNSYINQLYTQGQIENKFVGLNYEDPKDQRSISTISFGFFDYTQIQGGNMGFQYYSNVGLNSWAVLMDKVEYNGHAISGNGVGKMALIDSGNSSIQIPQSQFGVLTKKMKMQDSTLEVQVVEDMEILVSKKNCEDLYSVYANIEFMIQDARIMIKPEGYLYNLDGQDDCFVGIQSIPDKANQYRLGTIFLRNFYTGLDFEKNQILIGLNDGTTTAELHGTTHNTPVDPNSVDKPKQDSGAMMFVITFIILMFAVALACYVRTKKLEDGKAVTFSHISSEDMKKKYRNGVEVKPSEVVKERQTVSINDSLAEEDHQEILDKEETLLDQ